MSITPSGNWTLGGTAIAVDRDSRKREAKFSKIEILDATETVLHTSGKRSEERIISGLVQGSDIDTLMGYLDTIKALVSSEGSQGNYYIKDVKRDRVQDISTTDEVCRLTFDLVKQ